MNHAGWRRLIFEYKTLLDEKSLDRLYNLISWIMRHFSFPLLIHFEFGRKRRQGRSKRRTWNLIRLHVYKKGDEKKKTQQSRTRERMKVHTSSPLTVISISYSRRIARPSAHHHQTIKCIWINIGHARISRFIFDAAEYIYYKFHEFLVIRQLFWITNIIKEIL